MSAALSFSAPLPRIVCGDDTATPVRVVGFERDRGTETTDDTGGPLLPPGNRRDAYLLLTQSRDGARWWRYAMSPEQAEKMARYRRRDNSPCEVYRLTVDLPDASDLAAAIGDDWTPADEPIGHYLQVRAKAIDGSEEIVWDVDDEEHAAEIMKEPMTGYEYRLLQLPLYEGESRSKTGPKRFPEDREIADNIVAPHLTKWRAYEIGYPEAFDMELVEEFDTQAEAEEWLRDWEDDSYCAAPFLVPPVKPSSARRSKR